MGSLFGSEGIVRRGTDIAVDPGGFASKDGGDSGSAAAAAANAASQRSVGELRRQFDLTREDLAPFLEAGLGALGGVQEGSTVEGLEARLGRIFNTNAFRGLVDERTRSVEGQLAAGGLTRSGTALQEISEIPSSIGLQIENLLSGRLAGLASGGQSAAAGLGGLGAQSSGAIANQLSQQGENTASGILADRQAQAQNQQNLLGAAATAASIFFSDENLKKDIEQISTLYFEDPQNPGEAVSLDLVQWTWIPETVGTMVEKCGTIGFIAQEVKEKLPEYVAEQSGFLCIDYPRLLDDMCSDRVMN